MNNYKSTCSGLLLLFMYMKVFCFFFVVCLFQDVPASPSAVIGLKYVVVNHDKHINSVAILSWDNNTPVIYQFSFNGCSSR